MENCLVAHRPQTNSSRNIARDVHSSLELPSLFEEKASEVPSWPAHAAG